MSEPRPAEGAGCVNAIVQVKAPVGATVAGEQVRDWMPAVPDGSPAVTVNPKVTG